MLWYSQLLHATSNDLISTITSKRCLCGGTCCKGLIDLKTENLNCFPVKSSSPPKFSFARSMRRVPRSEPRLKEGLHGNSQTSITSRRFLKASQGPLWSKSGVAILANFHLIIILNKKNKKTLKHLYIMCLDLRSILSDECDQLNGVYDLHGSAGPI